MLKNVRLTPISFPGLSQGHHTTVAFCNGQVLVGEHHGKLRIMNEDLEVIENLGAAIPLAQSITGNHSYIATSDYQARVRHENKTFVFIVYH